MEPPMEKKTKNRESHRVETERLPLDPMREALMEFVIEAAAKASCGAASPGTLEAMSSVAGALLYDEQQRTANRS